jgi:guanylate kinase
MALASNPNALNSSRRGLLMIISSPSGAGKTSLCERLLTDETQLSMSVSATTRAARPGEVDGKHYHFVDEARFEQMIEASAFLEWAHVFGHRYGTPHAPVELLLSQGRDVLFDIDWQGTQQVRDRIEKDVVAVFILPPSMKVLGDRLQGRGKDSMDVIAGRMAKAADEISHWPEYDYVLINEDFDSCLSQLRNILAAERLKRRRQLYLSAFVKKMLEQD